MGVAVVQVPLIAGSRQLLAVVASQQTDGIGNPLEVALPAGRSLVDRQQPGVGGPAIAVGMDGPGSVIVVSNRLFLRED